MRMRLALCLLLLPPLCLAEVPPGYRAVAEAYGIPPALFYAVALTESEAPGIGKPWPWTANVEGEGYYFESRQALYDHLNGLLQQGRTNFDVGPGQINWRWNAGLFDSLWQATDPYVNLEIAAAMIRGYYRETGSFDAAVGKYHAPNNPTNAARYQSRVRQRLALVESGRR